MSEITPPVPSPTYDFPPSVPVYFYRPMRRRYWLHAVLLLATIFTTLVVGARMQYNFNHDLPAFSTESLAGLFPISWVREQPSRVLLGIPFSVTLLTMLLGVPFAATLMLILLAHEMGHFYYCVRYGVNATLPYFIPAPTLIGTLGAFIRIRSPIRSRSALFDIGIAGPIAGFVVGVVALAVALCFSKPMTIAAQATDIDFGYPFIFYLVQNIAGHISPDMIWHTRLHQLYLHAMAIAAWVGMFATALNLLPGGQLDGGHIVYALSPRRHKITSRVTVVLLIFLAWFWAGWLVWSLLLMVTGTRHPQVPTTPGLGIGRYFLAVVALLMLLMTFVPAPFGDAGFYAMLR
jgi:membrane-associated protease RseP (regulator of RpoE activity)